MLATPELLQEAALSSSLDQVLSRSVREIPLYGNRIKGSRLGESAELQLQLWPLITKEDIRRSFPSNFLGEGATLEELVDREDIELEHTSGTSEQRTALLLPRGWWAEQELRTLNLNATVADLLRQNPDAKRATINSPVCSGDIRYHGVPSRTDRIVGNALFVSLSRFPFLWSERDLDRIAEEILEWKPEYGVVFALYCERHGIRLPSLRFVICSYEFVSLVHRAILQRAFGVPVFDLYGSTETGHLLMEDTTGRMRPSLETAFLEVLEPDALGIGHLVVTTLTNPFMPLIRYRIGDLVKRMETPYGMRYILHGRTADAFETPAGQRVTTRQVDQCFAGFKGLAHYQLIQRPHWAWTFRFVPDHHGPEPHQLRDLVQALEQLLQVSVPIALQETDMLAPESSGKFRLGYPAKRG
jgi:phenylacetate-CoA ligase